MRETVLEAAKAELAPRGVLRAAINLGNFLLVTGRTPSGDPEGVAPDMARAAAERLGVAVRFVTYPSPSALAAAVEADAWDIGLIGAEPQRAAQIAFSPAYVEIDATYLVPAGSPLASCAEADRPGVRIAVAAGSAYDLWLARNIKHAVLVRAPSGAAAFKLFLDEGLEALAGLRAGLLNDLATAPPGARVLAGRFTAVQQAIGTPRRHRAAPAFLRAFVEEAKATGAAAALLARHGVADRLSVAPPA
ncbi:MAG: transporter substrate-binding domain-containing protein [Hyphomonadaceae bacterium]